MMLTKKLFWTGVALVLAALTVAPSANALPALCQFTPNDPFACVPFP